MRHWTRLLALPGVKQRGRAGAEAECNETRCWMRLIVGLCTLAVQRCGQEVSSTHHLQALAQAELSSSRLQEPGLQFEQAVALQAEP